MQCMKELDTKTLPVLIVASFLPRYFVSSMAALHSSNLVLAPKHGTCFNRPKGCVHMLGMQVLLFWDQHVVLSCFLFVFLAIVAYFGAPAL